MHKLLLGGIAFLWGSAALVYNLGADAALRAAPGRAGGLVALAFAAALLVAGARAVLSGLRGR